MTQPTVFGRKLPRNDYEGDDGVVSFRTCRDSSIGRIVAFATNGRVDRDGRVYRAAVTPHDPDGITIEQAAQAVLRVAHLKLVVPRWGMVELDQHLAAARGVVVDGWYDALPLEDRCQAGDDHFTHSIFASHSSAKTGNVRVWDALDKDLTGYGRWIGAKAFWLFAASLHYQCSYVPLQHL
jgi:hypothetical protein